MIKDTTVDLTEANITYLRYRDTGGALKQSVVIEHAGNKYRAYKKSVTHLCRYLGLSRRELDRMRDYRERNRIVNEAKEGISVTIAFDEQTGGIVRLTSPKFTPILHRTVIGAIRNTLLEEGTPFTSNITPSGRYGEFVLDMGYADLVKYKIWYFNFNDSEHALRIGSGWNILACQNGVINHKSRSFVALRHILDDPVTLIKEAVHKQLIFLADIPQIIEGFKKRPLSFDNGMKIIFESNYPEFIKRQLRKRFKEDADGTMWGLLLSLTFIGTHGKGLSLEQKVKLAEDSTRLEKAITVG